MEGGERDGGGTGGLVSTGGGSGFTAESRCWTSACPASLSRSERRSETNDLTLRESVVLNSVSWL